jgi:cell division protein FtsL
MSQLDIEYAIKKDVRNNPIVREVDAQQKRTFARTLLVTAAVVGMLLFSAWQHFAVLQHGYEIGALEQQLAQEDVFNRRLRLELEALRAPSRIEQIALTDLHMVAPTQKDSVVIERIPASAPTQNHAAIVARAR